MLLSLAIRNFVIVDALDLEFSPGFTVLTGETGAGKSILIDALLLALGERADADVIRAGASRAEVTAEFAVSPVVQAWLAERELMPEGSAQGIGMPGADSTLLLRRTVDTGGRGKGFINGTPAPLAQLREVGALLVDVHGQHAHQSLLKPAAQLQLLDEHGQLAPLAAAVNDRFETWRRAVRDRSDAEATAAGAAAQRERLGWLLDELTELAPQDGEWAAVQAEHRRLSHAASLIEGAQAAVDALAQSDDAALGHLDLVLTRLHALAAYDERLQAISGTIESARIQIDDAARELQHYLGRIALDDARLAELDQRMGKLHAAGRKFRCAPEALPALLAESTAQLQALSAAGDLAALQARETGAHAAYQQLAQQLAAARREAAAQMGREVTRAMQDLSMAGGRFVVELTPCEAAATGLERAEFTVTAHAGTAPRPLARVASGGELARISLAIAVIAATATPVSTLIFDEVDAGIGGAVAETVGRLLKALGQARQVLCVTHLPQVAARGDQHLQVTKATADDGKPVSRIATLNRQARVEELARMLGGVAITETTRKHAREMLAA
jgi:DNA repair protein RecN (Recombination protein N)